MAHSRHKYMLGLAGAASSSTGTSNPVFVGDCRLLSVSIQSSTGSASNITIQLSNDDGFKAAPAFWSTVTVLPNQGIYAIDPGARWVRAERANIAVSAASNCTVTLNKYYE